AAHWLYKGLKSQGAVDQLMASIREILEHNASPDDLMKEMQMGLYQEEIFVFTPRGDVFKLPKGATVLDLAFQIHTKLGLSCVGAKVGNRNVKINYQLHSGDQVEILTSPQQTPKRDWLNIVVTGKARLRIRQGLKEIENREAEVGKEMLQRRFKNRKIQVDEGTLSNIILKMGFKTQTQFFHALSLEEFNVDDVIKVYDEMQAPSTPPEDAKFSAQEFNYSAQREQQQKEGSAKEDVLVIDKDLKGLDYSLAGCCHPIYGDDVVGFVSISGGIRIHRCDCVNIRNLQEQYPYRIVRAKWSGKSGSQYSITLRVIGHDDIGIVSNISSVINKERDTLLRAINIDAAGGIFHGHLTVVVQDLSSLNSLIKKIKTIHGVKQVERVN
ncbi:MAG: TGS domain-containing protein, partial [Bacteroidales bacterium]|nr:TGS domain-containing protein [Bacteroidales bacterium]